MKKAEMKEQVMELLDQAKLDMVYSCYAPDLFYIHYGRATGVILSASFCEIITQSEFKKLLDDLNQHKETCLESKTVNF